MKSIVSLFDGKEITNFLENTVFNVYENYCGSITFSFGFGVSESFLNKFVGVRFLLSDDPCVLDGWSTMSLGFSGFRAGCNDGQVVCVVPLTIVCFKKDFFKRLIRPQRRLVK